VSEQRIVTSLIPGVTSLNDDPGQGGNVPECNQSEPLAWNFLKLPVDVFFAAIQFAPDPVKLSRRAPVQLLAFGGAVSAFLAASALHQSGRFFQTKCAMPFQDCRV
jgi:hypothetical protein